MTKSIQQVKQNLADLKSRVIETATELEELHRDYLNLLSQSLKQQLILSCYQICTQLYPQAFINLSLSAKQDLQQSLRQLSLELQPQLLDLVAKKELESEPNDLNLIAKLIESLPKSKSPAKDRLENTSRDISKSMSLRDSELVKAEIANLENIENIEDIELIAIDTGEDEEPELEEPFEGPLEEPLEEPPEKPPEEATKEVMELDNPEHLISWHKQIERGITKTLDDVSRQVNKRLQLSNIIPDRLPKKVVDVAMQAESSKGMRNNAQQPKIPHVMHLVLESDLRKKSQPSKKPMQISLLRLRLAEVEFSDHLLNAKRGQIRNLIGKIQQLKGQHNSIQQELAVIEAQAAWRSSWYED